MDTQLITDKERRVLESLFRTGQSTVNQISKDTLVNRTALYHTLNLLIKKGLITQIKKEKVSYYQSVTIDQFETWAKAQLRSIQENYSSDLQKFKSVQKKDNLSLYADVKYFEGMDGMKNLFSDTIYNNKGKQLFTITDYEKGYIEHGDWFNEVYLPERVKRGIKVKSMLPDTPIGRSYTASAKELLREMCFVDIFKDLGLEICLYDSKIAIVVFDEKHPLGIIIQNPIISKAFQQIFAYLWKTGIKAK
jgi:sugar-specific transcriptional regulator TrmB